MAKAPTKPEPGVKPRLEYLSAKDKWIGAVDSDLKPPVTVRTTKPSKLRLAGSGWVELGARSQVHIGAERASLRLLKGSFLIEAAGSDITIKEDDRSIIISSGQMAARTYPDYKEYRSLGTQMIVESTDKFKKQRREVYSSGTSVLSNGVRVRPVEGLPVVAGPWTVLTSDDYKGALIGPEFLKPKAVGFDFRGPGMPSSRKLTKRGLGLGFGVNTRGTRAARTPLVSGLRFNEATRELGWHPSPMITKKTKAYRVELSHNRVGPMWGTTTDQTSATIPEYVKLKYGGYHWTVAPIVAEGIVDYKADGRFKIVDPNAKERPHYLHIPGDFKLAVEGQLDKSPLEETLRDRRNKVSEGKILLGKLNTGHRFLIPGTADFDVRMGSEGGVQGLRFEKGSVWLKMDGRQPFTLGGPSKTLKFGNQECELLFRAKNTKSTLIVLKGKVKILNRDKTMSAGDILELPWGETSKLAPDDIRAQAFKKLDFQLKGDFESFFSQ